MATTTRKSTGTKRTASRKAGTAKSKGAASRAKATAKTADSQSKTEARQARDAEMTERMLELREEGESWSTIGEDLGITPGKAQFLLMLHKVATGEVKRLPFRNDDELAAKIAKARDAADEFSSWGWISARTGVSEPKLKRLHEENSNWTPRSDNISVTRAQKNGGGSTAKKSTGSRKAGTTTRGKSGATASKAAKAKAKARARGKAADPS
jgi:hypothetical protein